MIKTLLLFLPIFFSTQVLQEYIDYPFDQYAYLGGKDSFYSDFHSVSLQGKLKPCENKNELFIAKILIDGKGNAKLINDLKPKNENSNTFWNNDMYENKCTIQLIKNVLSHLEPWKWVPAKVSGKEIAAVEKYIIYPDNLFSHKYLEDGFKEAQYNHVSISDQRFHDEIDKNLDISDFRTTKSGKISVGTSFDINIDGKIENIKIIKSSGSEGFDERFIIAIKRLKKNWIPAKIHNYPTTQNIKFLFTTNY